MYDSGMRFSPTPAAGARCGRLPRDDLGPLAIFAPTGAEALARLCHLPASTAMPPVPYSLSLLFHYPVVNRLFSNCTSALFVSSLKALLLACEASPGVKALLPASGSRCLLHTRLSL